jgi:hypothetical protein
LGTAAAAGAPAPARAPHFPQNTPFTPSAAPQLLQKLAISFRPFPFLSKLIQPPNSLRPLPELFARAILHVTLQAVNT